MTEILLALGIFNVVWGQGVFKKSIHVYEVILSAVQIFAGATLIAFITLNP